MFKFSRVCYYLLNLRMIQRKQTLFLLELIFLSISLFFIPSDIILKNDGSVNVYLLPASGNYDATAWHLVALTLNLSSLVLSVICIFLYKKRVTQMRLCYLIAALWIIQSLVLAFCPLAVFNMGATEIQINYFGSLIGVFAVIAAVLAARFIKKDIELLKSADRIR